MSWFLVFAVPWSVISAANMERAGEFSSLEDCREAALAATDPRGHYCVNFPDGKPWQVGARVDYEKIPK